MLRTVPFRRSLAAASIVALSLTAVACGSDDSASSADTDTATTEESHEIVSDADVTSGLAATIADATALAGRIGNGASNDDYETMFEGWEGYEGTVKQNEPDSYLAIEDALTALKGAIETKDTDAGTAAVADLQTAASAYLEKHP